MKKFTKLLMLLVISMSVNSSPVCNSACPLNAIEAKLQEAKSDQQTIDENDWILHTRFKY